MVTQLGIFLRDLRLNSGELLKEMAEKLDVSSSFLSAVENGKKKIPEFWYDTIVNLYDLDKEKQDELRQAIEESQKRIKINFKNSSSVKELENLNKEEVDKMKIFLKKEDKQK